MTISELIKQLEAIKAEHGDLPVVADGDSGYYSVGQLDYEAHHGHVMLWEGVA